MIIERRTVDLSDYPDLVVIYLGMKADDERGAKSLQSFVPRMTEAVAAPPEGLLCHENFGFSTTPPSVVFRQYWTDFRSLEAWTRSLAEQEWWREFLDDPQEMGLWHETYFMRGGMEAIYDNQAEPTGFSTFAPTQPARGPLFSSRRRLGREAFSPNLSGGGEKERLEKERAQQAAPLPYGAGR